MKGRPHQTSVLHRRIDEVSIPSKDVSTDVSFHRRPLPEHLIAFDSDQGRELFKSMLNEGGAKSYWSLAGQFLSQQSPSLCALASLVMCLNALKIDPKRIWQGVWRWWDEKMLGHPTETNACRPDETKSCGCAPFEKAATVGVTLEELLSYAKCNRVEAKGYFASDTVGERIRSEVGVETRDIDHFRDVLRRTQLETTEEGDQKKQELLIVSFSRPALGQTGDGHFSPIGGYCPSKDAVLVMDVARFKYPSYFVPVEDLWRAMRYVDIETLKPRGYVVVSGETAVASGS